MSTTRCMSLVERKRLQWAQEREELANLNHPWGAGNAQFERYDTKVQMVKNYNIEGQSGRRSSLPPLYKNKRNLYDKDRDIGGETSGYGSDCNKTPETSNWNQSGYESSSSRDDRPKWGDKGVGVGKFWEPKDDSFEKITTSEPPNWVKRGLKDGEIEVNNTSPAESPEQKYEDNDRPFTGSSYNSNTRVSYLRGQNIPMDAQELAERERRRQVALSHQEAIRQQLEERERRKREERERKLREEREEELRIERDQEKERRRREEEIRLIKEKQEREQKRKEAIQEAIELAQKGAEIIKNRKKISTVNLIRNGNDNKSSNVSNSNNEGSDSLELGKNDEDTPQQLNNLRKTPVRIEPLANDVTNNLEITGKSNSSPRSVKASPRHNSDTESSVVKESNNNSSNTYINQLPNYVPTPRTENVLLLQTATDMIPNLQYALLVPIVSQNIPVVPSSIPQSARSCSSTVRTENRLLTPTIYRNKNVMFCDSSTQTDDTIFNRNEMFEEKKEKFLKEKLTNLELSYENRKKERRSRSESLEERPKWGANRPPTRYLKQSEKDLLYTRRKVRQKVRGIKGYDYKNSSDDSQPGSPRSYRRKSYSEKRSSRALWRKQDQIFSRNISMYRTEVIPLESDRGQIYYKNECCCSCRCSGNRRSEGQVDTDIFRIEHFSPRDKTTTSNKIEKLPEMPKLDDNNYSLLPELHCELSVKEEQWEQTLSTPSISSAK